MSVHLITGAGSGIGSVVARRLLDRGDQVVVLARDAGRAKEITAALPGASAIGGDLAQPGRLSWALSKQALPERIDSLIHAAGVVDLGPVADLAANLWERCLLYTSPSPRD